MLSQAFKPNPEPVVAETASTAPTRRILIIDDDVPLHLSVKKLLQRHGYEVTVAETADEGIHLARTSAPQVILCDWHIADISGLQVLETLRADPATAIVPFILITGEGDASVMRKVMASGADDFLRKPLVPDELLAAIEARLKQHSAHQTLQEKVVEHRSRGKMSEMQTRIAEQARIARIQAMALESASNGIVITDCVGKILWVNPAFTKLSGYAREEVVGNATSMLKSGQHGAGFYQQMWKAVLNGEVWTGQLINRRKDGTLYDEEMTITPVRDENGKVQNFIAIKQDISKRKKFEKDLAHERDLLQSLMDNLPDLIYFKDQHSHFTRINRALASLLGLNNPEEAVGKSDADYFPPHLARQKLADEARVLENGEAIINLIERSETHGAEYWASSTKVPIRGANGQITGLAGISRNITEFKLAEEALRQKTALMEAQLNSSIEGIMVVDRQGKKVLQNQRCIDLWKIPPQVAEYDEDAKQVQHVMNMTKHPEQFAEKVAYLYDHPDETSRDEIELIDGTILDRYSAPVLGKDGQNYGRIWAFHDITERKQAEQARQAMEIQLRQGQKLESIGQLAAGIAHEINTPTQYIGDNTRFLSDAFTDINVLLSLYEKLSTATPETLPAVMAELQAAAGRVDCAYLRDEIPRAIQQSLEGVDRVAKIVRAMKEFSHPGTEEKTPVDLNHAIEVTLAVSHNEWKYVAEVKNDFDPALPTVPCLPGELNQVFLNLIVNAAHAIADVVGPAGNTKGLITIRTRRDADWVEVRIQDSGTGIPETVRPRMFEPFFTTKGVGKGTGQGLAIAHSVIVKKHGGTIHFETETGKGTTFVIRLPLTAVKPEAKK